MAETVRMYDSGVHLKMTVKDESGTVNVVTAQAVTLFMQKPDKSIISRPCSFVTPTLGVIEYVTQPDDLDQSGTWKLQLVIKFANDNIKHSEIGSLTVEKNISTF